MVSKLLTDTLPGVDPTTGDARSWTRSAPAELPARGCAR